MKPLACFLAVPAVLTAYDQPTREEIVHRLNDSASAFGEIMAAPDKGIPQDLLDKSRCIVIVPGVRKGAVVIGAEYGNGFISCRSTEAPVP